MPISKLPAYNAFALEEEVQARWKSEKTREHVREKRKDCKKLYFLDGPPFPTGAIHVGTAWNKILKDFYIKYNLMKGFLVNDTPGYDTHGLPTENKVVNEMGITKKKDIEDKIGIDKFVAACKKSTLDNIEPMNEEFKNLGVWMDWEHPYITFNNSYLESAWGTFKKAYDKGLFYKGARVQHVCPHCETVLAKHELEYTTLRETSVYLKFPIKGKKNEFLLVWTTTPWTLLSNVAIAVHPDFDYVKLDVGHEKLIVAKERVHILEEKFNLCGEVVEEFKGKNLDGLEYEPLLDDVPVQQELVKSGKALRVVATDEKICHGREVIEAVTLSDGSGLVHIAPGHGEIDEVIGEKNGFPSPSPLGFDGMFTEEAGKYKGTKAKEIDPQIIEDIYQKGRLYERETVAHEYPCCNRCHTPVLMMKTTQWFLRSSQFAPQALEDIKKVKWAPKEGYNRMESWVAGLEDWVLSRQRYWGIPIPVWICEKCDKWDVVGSFKELKKKSIGKVSDDMDLHRPYIDAIKIKCKCGGVMHRIPDILDGWFDSGIAPWASMEYPMDKKKFKEWGGCPVAYIIEGSDQYKCWYSSLMWTSYAMFGKLPYKAVVTHSLINDYFGVKMSKSKGNIVSPGEALGKKGRDPLRGYLLSCNAGDELQFAWEGLNDAFKDITVYWNVLTFATSYMELDSFDPTKYSLAKLPLNAADKWLLSRMNSVVKQVTEYADNFEHHNGLRVLRDFIVNDLSRWYIRQARERVWVEKDDPDKLAAYMCMHYALARVNRMLAPYMPHLCEFVHDRLERPFTNETSVFAEDWPKVEKKYIKPELEEKMKTVMDIVAAVYSARQEANVKLRWPLRKVIITAADERIQSAVKGAKEMIKELTNVKDVRYSNEEKIETTLLAKPNLAVTGPTLKKDAPAFAKALESCDLVKLKGELDANGKAELDIGAKTIEVKPDYVLFSNKLPDEIKKVCFAGGELFIDTHMDDELMAEALSREVMRRIQNLRKKANLKELQKIKASISCAEGKWLETLGKFREGIAADVRAGELLIGVQKTGAKFTDRFEFEGAEFEVGIEA